MHYIFVARNWRNIGNNLLKKIVKRKVDKTYVIIYAIKNEVNIKKHCILKDVFV